jgi:hypothetical protein
MLGGTYTATQRGWRQKGESLNGGRWNGGSPKENESNEDRIKTVLMF